MRDQNPLPLRGLKRRYFCNRLLVYLVKSFQFHATTITPSQREKAGMRDQKMRYYPPSPNPLPLRGLKRRYFCNRLLGLSGKVISIKPACKAGRK